VQVTADGCIDSEYYGQSDMDIGHGQDKQEASDTYWKEMAKTFESEAASYMFYNSYARDHGFSVRKEKVKRAK